MPHSVPPRSIKSNPFPSRSAALAAALFLTAAEAAAQASGEFSPPRTADGRPDFQGVWTNASLTRLERAPEYASLVLTPEQAAEWEAAAAKVAAGDSAPTDPNAGAPKPGEDPEGYNFFWIDPGTKVGKVKGELRSSWLTDPPNGRVPYTPAARVAMMKHLSTFNSFNNPEERIVSERCILGFASTGGPPMLNALYNNHHQIVQTADALAIHVEMIHDTRVVRIGDSHNPPEMRRYLGDTIGRWEGDTLVAETVGFKEMDALRVDFGLLLYVSPDAKVTERFTLVGPDELHYAFTVEDAKAYTQPWSGELTFRRSDERIHEYACHEGNYSVPNILRGAREMERTGRKAAVTSPRSRVDR